MINSLPICFFPMHKIILDDDQAFLESIMLKNHNKHFLPYSSPKNALDYLLQEYKPILSKSNFISNDLSSSDSSTHMMGIHMENLKNVLLQPSHQDISVLFVDYHMPEMNGIDFLQKIKHLPIKKALITGEKDYRIGIDAFNSGLVDAYLRKDDFNFATKIQAIISDLEWSYFLEFNHLISDVPCFDYLKNSNLTSTFKEFIHKNQITAFCLSHIQGDFIAQDIKGRHFHVMVRSKHQLGILAKFAEEDNATPATVKDLYEGNMVPFFGEKDHWEIPGNEWSKFLHPVVDIPGDQNLVWAIIGD